MLAGKGKDDIAVAIKPSKNTKTQIRKEGLPTTLTVRFVRVTLETGEYEVLATSLLDPKQYPVSCFKELYYLRWGIETFYGTLKTRLNLENFTGLSPEAIRQDFFATIFLTGVESMLTLEAEAKLTKQKGGIPKKVNKAVSFNVIKEQAFVLIRVKLDNNYNKIIIQIMIEVTQKLIQIGSSNGVTLSKKDLKVLGAKRGDTLKLKVELVAPQDNQQKLMREYQDFVSIYGQTLKNLAGKWSLTI